MDKEVNDRPGCYRAVITGYGSFAPAKKLTNDDLAKMVHTSPTHLLMKVLALPHSP